MKRNIVLATQSEVFATGLTSILQQESSLLLEKQIATKDALVKRMMEPYHTLCILDLCFDHPINISLVKDMARCAPQKPLIVYSSQSFKYEPFYIWHCIQAGAKAYVEYQATKEDWLMAVHTIGAGKGYAGYAFSKYLVSKIQQDTMMHELHEHLSQRESEIFALLGYGYSMKEISANLNLSPRTVETHVNNIRCKFPMRQGHNVRDIAIICHARPEFNFKDVKTCPKKQWPK